MNSHLQQQTSFFPQSLLINSHRLLGAISLAFWGRQLQRPGQVAQAYSCTLDSVSTTQLPCFDARKSGRNASVIPLDSWSRVVRRRLSLPWPMPISTSSRSHAWLIARQTRGSSWMPRVLDGPDLRPCRRPRHLIVFGLHLLSEA